MMACSKNLSKHLKKCYQTKINMEMFQHDFQSFASLMIFLSKKKDKKFPFHSYFSYLCKISNPKERKKTWACHACLFECFQLHCHNFKKLHEFLHMMNAITTFE